MVASPYLLETWFDPRLELRSSPISDTGLFATDLIRQGEVVMIWGGTLFTEQDRAAGRIGPHLSCSVTKDGRLLCGRDDLMDQYVNHSCDPNVWMVDDVTIVARRTIQPGEEIMGDYALWESNPTSIIDSCACGSALCRGKFTGDDWRLPELQARYKGHFLPAITRLIAETPQEL